MSTQILSHGRPAGHRYVNVAGRQCLDTGTVVIGSCHMPRPPVCTRDGETLQEAFLEPRTAKPRPLSMRLLGGLWRWC